MPSSRPNSTNGPSVPVRLTGGRQRRSDAERNRTHVLAVARRLVRERGISDVTMDLLAAEAGVGKGTLYRGFGSRAGLAEALLDEAERDLQEQILSGPPPLGSGASPAARLRSFVSAYLDLLATNVDLLIETERGTPGARFHTGAYSFWHAHITVLLRDQGHSDPDVRAHALLSMLAGDFYQHLRALEIDPVRIEALILDLIGNEPG